MCILLLNRKLNALNAQISGVFFSLEILYVDVLHRNVNCRFITVYRPIYCLCSKSNIGSSSSGVQGQSSSHQE